MEAQNLNLEKYFTGKPCKHGHVSERYSKSANCVECKQTQSYSVYRLPNQKKKISDYRKKSRDKIREQERRTRLKHPATLANKNALRRAIEKAAGSFTNEELLSLRDSQPCCLGCGCKFSSKIPSTIDHKTPICLGGSNTIDNLQLLCKPCNSSKGGKPYNVWLNEKSSADSG